MHTPILYRDTQGGGSGPELNFLPGFGSAFGMRIQFQNEEEKMKGKKLKNV